MCATLRLRILLCVGMVLMVVTSPCAGQGTNDRPQDRVRRLMALGAAKKRVEMLVQSFETLENLDESEFGDTLQAQIYDNIEKHIDRSTSEKLCAVILKDAAEESFEASYQAILAWANGQSPIPIKAADLEDKMKRTQTKLQSQAVSRLVASHGTALFNTARDACVRRQQVAIQIEITRPSFTTVDDTLSHAQTRMAFRQELTSALLKQTVAPDLRTRLLQENDRSISTQISEVVHSIDQQYEKQLVDLERIARDVPAKYRASESISNYLISRLKVSLPDGSREPPESVYSVFSVVRDKSDKNAAVIERTRFDEFLKNYSVILSKAQIKVVILSDLPGHQKRADSKDKLLRNLEREQKDILAQAYSRDANDATVARTRATALLREEQPSTLVKQKTGRALNPVLNEIRSEIADDQLSTHFPRLASRTGDLPPVKQWIPSISLIDKQYQAQKLSRASSIRTMADAITLLAGEDFTPVDLSENWILDETEQKVLSVMNERLDAGLGDLRSQLTLVYGLDHEKRKELQSHFEKGGAYSEIYEEWRSQLDSRWKLKILESHSPYQSLFPTIELVLATKVRQFCNAIASAKAVQQSMKPAQVTTADPKQTGDAPDTRQSRAPKQELPGDSSRTESSGDGSGGKDDADSDGTLLPVARQGAVSATKGPIGDPSDCVLHFVNSAQRPGMCVAILQAHGSERELARLEFSPIPIEESSNRIAIAISAPMTRLAKSKLANAKAGNGGTNLVEFRLTVKVASDLVRHTMSLSLRSHLQEQIRSVRSIEDRSLELIWIDILDRPRD